MAEFFGWPEYTRQPEGVFSWQHILWSSIAVIIMVTLAIIIGKRKRNKSYKEKNRVLIIAAIFMDCAELYRILINTLRANRFSELKIMIPLYLCSTMFIVLPIAAFSKGRIKEAALDYCGIFGLVMAISGTFLAANTFDLYPIISHHSIITTITHCSSGFVSLYIIISKMASMKIKNIPICYAIITFFSIAAWIVNYLLGTNYMFLKYHDGTPYSLIYNLFDGNQILYPISVVLIFYLLIALFYICFNAIRKKINHN